MTNKPDSKQQSSNHWLSGDQAKTTDANAAMADFLNSPVSMQDMKTPHLHDTFIQEPLVITITASDGDTENAVLTYDINGIEKTIEWNDLYVLYETHVNGSDGDQSPEQRLLGKITAEFWLDDDCWWVDATSTNAIAVDEDAITAPPQVRPRI